MSTVALLLAVGAIVGGPTRHPGIHFEVVDSVDPVKVGGETVYEVKVRNTGTAADQNLLLECRLPGGMTLVKVSGPADYLERVGIDFTGPGPHRTTSTVTFEPLPELQPGAEVVFRVKVKAGAAGVGVFRAMLTSDHLTTPVSKEEPTTVCGR
jgi:uncharacterized repeat protein (TIGR01451 family)